MATGMAVGERNPFHVAPKHCFCLPMPIVCDPLFVYDEFGTIAQDSWDLIDPHKEREPKAEGRPQQYIPVVVGGLSATESEAKASQPAYHEEDWEHDPHKCF